MLLVFPMITKKKKKKVVISFFLEMLAKTKVTLFLVQLGCRLLHILKRLLPISVFLLQV